MATLDPVINFGKVTVSTGYDASATSIDLVAGQGAELPATFSYNLVWWDSTLYDDPADDPNVEIVRCTGRSTDTLTITRAQEGTSATVKNVGGSTYKIILAVTKKMIDDIESTNLGDNLTSSTNDILTTNGTLVFGGSGGVNNNKITLDVESDPGEIAISSFSTTEINITGISLALNDDTAFRFGDGPDVTMYFDGNSGVRDSFYLTTGVATDAQTGYIILADSTNASQASRIPAAASADPTLRIYATGTTAGDYLEFYHDQTDAVIDWGAGDLIIDSTTSGGNVGIGAGNTSPATALDVVGNVTLEDSEAASNTYKGVIYKGATSFIHNFKHDSGDSAEPLGFNTFVGLGAGNFTMGSTATSTSHGSYNNAIGSEAGQGLTTGFQNNFIGYRAGYLNTTATYNNFMGTQSGNSTTTGGSNNFMGAFTGFANTSGAQNCFIGYSSGGLNTIGDNNTFLGAWAGRENTDGDDNLYIGNNAGRFIVGGATANETSDKCICIGSYTDTSADGAQNENVIGYNAIGKGSNTTIIGEEGVHTRVYVSGGLTVNELGEDYDTRIEGSGAPNALFVQGSDGFVGIGTATPATMLEVAGNIGTNSQILHNGDTNTHVSFFDDRIKLTAGSVEFLDARELPASQDYINIGTTTTSDIDVYLDNGSLVVEGSSSNVGIGTGIGVAPTGELHVDQSDSAGAEPVLVLDQADVDEDYIKIIGTSDTNVDRALVDAADFTTPGSIVGWLKINVQDDQSTNPITDGDYYIPFYGAPSA